MRDRCLVPLDPQLSLQELSGNRKNCGMSCPEIHPVNAIMRRERKRRDLIPAHTPHDSIIWKRERFRILHDEKGKKITQRHCVLGRSGSIFKVKTYKKYFLFPEKMKV